LERHPEVNAVWDVRCPGASTRSTSGSPSPSTTGLIVPVVHRANELDDRRGEASERRRRAGAAGLLLPDDVSGGTFTLSNLGSVRHRLFTDDRTAHAAAILAVAVSPIGSWRWGVDRSSLPG
jgi:pyruvate dehydrogenase E2 component (dihydrolipoamide acetyltransferase)